MSCGCWWSGQIIRHSRHAISSSKRKKQESISLTFIGLSCNSFHLRSSNNGRHGRVVSVGRGILQAVPITIGVDAFIQNLGSCISPDSDILHGDVRARNLSRAVEVDGRARDAVVNVAVESTVGDIGILHTVSSSKCLFRPVAVDVNAVSVLVSVKVGEADGGSCAAASVRLDEGHLVASDSVDILVLDVSDTWDD